MKRLLLVLAVVGCGTGKGKPNDDVTAAFVADSKADLPTSTKTVGRVDVNGAALTFHYTRRPTYRIAWFQGVPGDDVVVTVTSDNGDPIAWLLDFQGNVIDYNDDASSDVTFSRIRTTLPVSNGRYYVYVRDYDKAPADFSLTVAGGHPAGPEGDAERAYDAAIPNWDTIKIDRSALPAAAQTKYDDYVTRFNGAEARAFDHYVAVSSGQEELFWVDVFDADGTFLVHGYSGDGGPDVGWAPSPYDPSTH